MSAFLFYPVYWLFYAFSLFPMKVLYLFSSLLKFFLFDVFSYRKEVINENLKNAFPEKSRKELQQIKKAFMSHFCDFFVESLKRLSISNKNISKRFVFDKNSKEIIEGFFARNKKVIIVLGHYGNWEYMGSGFKFWLSKPLVSAYKPLRGKIADRILLKSRERFDTIMVPMNSLTREMFRLKEEVCAVLLLADQSPPMNRQSYWMNFLNQETPVFQGTEKIAAKFDIPVLFADIRKVKRGYYKCFFEIVSESPKGLPEGALTYKHTKMLEKAIIRDPRYWLWTHKRWKHKEKRGNKPLLFSGDTEIVS